MMQLELMMLSTKFVNNITHTIINVITQSPRKHILDKQPQADLSSISWFSLV